MRRRCLGTSLYAIVHVSAGGSLLRITSSIENEHAPETREYLSSNANGKPQNKYVEHSKFLRRISLQTSSLHSTDLALDDYHLIWILKYHQ